MKLDAGVPVLTNLEICRHCEADIAYSTADTVYLHVERTWGSDWFFDKDYNNRFYCDESRATMADPAK